MKLIKILAVAATLAAQAPVFAQTAAPTIAKWAKIYSADGAKVGRVEVIVNNADGSVAGVKTIYQEKFLTIPASTLSAGTDGLKTSLTKAELRKM